MLCGCGGDSTETGTQVDNSSINSEKKLYPINTDPRLNFGSIQSLNNNIINLNYNFNSWGTTLIGGVDKEISLKVKQEINTNQYDPSALWAFFIRRKNPSLGIYYADELETKLLFRYSRNVEICCDNTRPFSDFDLAERSYIAVDGFIDFKTDNNGIFDMTFQQETEVGSGQGIGAFINVVGCWNIGGEGGPSGCEIH